MMVTFSRMETVEQVGRTVHTLQQLQCLFPNEATLEDVTQFLTCLETQHGAACLLEDVIQHYANKHLALQIEQRTKRAA